MRFQTYMLKYFENFVVQSSLWNMEFCRNPGSLGSVTSFDSYHKIIITQKK